MKAAFFALFKIRKVRGSTGLFKMGEASRSSKKHYGIGLYMAENTAKLHGGKLAISNAWAAAKLRWYWNYFLIN